MANHGEILKRTEGDGMESDDNSNLSKEDKKLLEPVGLVKKLSAISLKTIPKENVVLLKPVLIPRKLSGAKSVNIKGPKFVPYEPYKAAVRPIVPKKKSKSHDGSSIISNVRPRSRPISCSSDYRSEPDVKEESKICSEQFNESQNEEVQRLRDENVELEKQLKFQAQINGELKNLLVAAVGEDIEVRVNSLTEDKLHLAQALLNSAKTLSTHQEQVEWLASQCEVWRSKFLASSVMVEELARWKATLSQRISDSQDAAKNLLEERSQLRRNLLHLYSNLCLLHDNFNIRCKRPSLKSSNNVDLTSASTSLISGLVVQLLGGDKEAVIDQKLQEYPHLTDAERTVDHLLKNPHPMQLIGEPDAACNAVVGAAVALHGQLFRQSLAPHITCCPQCTGKVHMV